MRKIQQIISSLFFSFFLSLWLPAQTMILPFKVTPPENTNHQWLGRAISFFLSTGLEINSVKILSETKMFSILGENNIHFPFHITKASGIKLALENDVEFIIWGNIITSPDQIELKSYIINLKNYSQKYLPLLKFDIKNFFFLQDELLKDVLKFFNITDDRVIYPQLNLNYYNYELLVKSLLSKDKTEKMTLLEKAYQNQPESDFLNLELTKAYLSRKEYQKAHFFLEKISDHTIFQQKKDFLNALIFFHSGYSNLAIDKFIKLQKENIFSFEIDNNLGAIYLKHQFYPMAEKYFLSALSVKNDPRIYLNYIKLLLDSGKMERAIEITNRALVYFPGYEKIKELFFFFLANDNNRNTLIKVFKKYIPDLQTVVTLPELPIQMINPLQQELNNSYNFQNELNKIIEHYYSGDLKQTLDNGEEILEINPFIPELHHLISTIYLKQKNLLDAEMYALSSNFLKKTKDSYIILIEINNLLKNNQKVNELKTELSKLISENNK